MAPDAAAASATGIAAAVAQGRTSAVAVAEAALARIARDDPRLNSFTAVTAERALAEARAVDRAVAEGRSPGPLAGVPYAVKNLFDVAGLSTLAGSKINRDRPPAAADGALVARMRRAGAVLVGALNMDEYAYGFTTENSHYGACRNPHDTGRVAGGSSGGCGAAVAGGLVPLSLGSDTNGSIRVPASLNGIFGLKPTYGRLSRAGSFPFVGSLDHLGPFARSARDLALCYDALQGWSGDDPAQARRPAEPTLPRLGGEVGRLRIAVAGGYFRESCEPEALAAVDLAAAALGATRQVEIPEAAIGRAAAFLITVTEGAQLHEANLRSRPDDFDPLVRDRLLSGLMLPAAWYVKAQRFRRWYRDRIARLFGEVDAILAPATPCVAPRIGQETVTLNGVELPMRPSLGLLTQPISFIGLPVAAVPVRRPSGGRTDLPLGVQVIAAPWREDVCLAVADALERAGAAASPVAAGFGQNS